eukprot:564483-Alexandrium_andersonii.AAC.1
MLALLDVQPDRVEEVERALGLPNWASRRIAPARLQLGPREWQGPAAGQSSRLHPPTVGQDLRWLLVTHGVLTPEAAARAVQGSVGAQRQAVQAMDPELNEYVDMVLLQGPPEARPPMESRLLRNPVARTPSGEFKLIAYTG